MGWIRGLFSRDFETRLATRHASVIALTKHLLRLTRWRHATVARRQRIIAVTGSQGKTTSNRCIRAALGLPAMRMAEESRNHRGWLGIVLLRQSPFRRWATVECAIASPHQMRGQVRTVRPTITVVTSIGSEHLRSFGTVERLRDEKADAVRILPRQGIAVVNGDDEHVRWIATQTTARVVTFGFDAGNDVRATNMALDWPRGTTFTVTIDGKEHPVRTRLIGKTMVYAALTALAVASAEGVGLDDAIRRLARMRPTRRRNQPIRLPNGAWALADDSNSSVETVDAALELFAEIPATRKIAVLGMLTIPPGLVRAAYRRVALQAGAISDRVIIVGQLEQYWPGLRDSGFTKADISVVRSATDAIELLRPDLRPGDVILLKGRGDQRMSRVALGLAGRDVRCRRESCQMSLDFCEACQLLTRP